MTNKNTLIILFYLIVLIISNAKLSAQPNIEWQKNYGGSGYNWVESIQQTTDGGYIVSGLSESNDGDVSGNNGGFDAWIIKLDISGNLEWEKNYGGSDEDIALSIQQTIDGGYIIAGRTKSNNGDVEENQGGVDAWIIKLDTSGNLEWEKTYGGSGWEATLSIQQTTDGGYIVGGWSESNDGDVGGNQGGVDAWIIKLDISGNLEWEKNYGGSMEDAICSIQQTTNDGYIAAGITKSNDGDVEENNGKYDYWILKLDVTGNIEWEKSYGGSDWDGASSIQQTTDNGYIVAGRTGSNDGDVGGADGWFDYWILKLDTEGNLEWEKKYGGSGWDAAHSIQQTKDGGYIAAGVSDSNDGDVGGDNEEKDAWIIKLDVEGNIEWKKIFGGSGHDWIRSIQQTIDGGYIVAGSTDTDSGDDFHYEYWIIKLSPVSVGTQTTIHSQNISIIPNPSIGDCTIYTNDLTGPITIKIFDAFGCCIYTNNKFHQSLNIDGITKGNYYVHITNDKTSYTRKLIIH